MSLLEDWVAHSSQATIGENGGYGRKAWISIHLNDDLVVALNSDTKRSGVTEFISHARQHGANAPWFVVATRGGVVSKVNFRADGMETPGWYCYLRKPTSFPSPRKI